MRIKKTPEIQPIHFRGRGLEEWIGEQIKAQPVTPGFMRRQAAGAHHAQ